MAKKKTMSKFEKLNELEEHWVRLNKQIKAQIEDHSIPLLERTEAYSEFIAGTATLYSLKEVLMDEDAPRECV